MTTKDTKCTKGTAAAVMWVAAAVCLAPGVGVAEELRFGTLRGRFVVTGELPSEPPAWAESPHGDTVARWAALRDARPLVIDPHSRGLANVLVYLRRPPTSVAVAEKYPRDEAVIRLKNGRFWPHMARVHSGQTIRVIVENGGPYNLHPRPFVNPEWKWTVSPGDVKVQTFRYDSPEFLPTLVPCDIHPWFVGYWLILDHPYSAVSDRRGRFEIAGLPEGEYEFIVWHERVGYLDRRVEGMASMFELRLEPGLNDLGEIEIPAKVFEPRR